MDRRISEIRDIERPRASPSVKMGADLSRAGIKDFPQYPRRPSVLRHFARGQIGWPRAPRDQFLVETEKAREMIKRDSWRIAPEVIWLRVQCETEFELYVFFHTTNRLVHKLHRRKLQKNPFSYRIAAPTGTAKTRHLCRSARELSGFQSTGRARSTMSWSGFTPAPPRHGRPEFISPYGRQVRTDRHRRFQLDHRF